MADSSSTIPMPAVGSRMGGRRALKSFFRLQRYRLTLEGWCFVLLMAMVGFAAWHSGTNLLYLVFAMLIGFFLAQGILVWICLLGVDARRVVPNHVFAQEEVLLPIVITNHKRVLSSYALRLMEYVSFSQFLGTGRLIGTGFVFRIPKNAETHASCRVVFPTRGIFVLKHLEVITRYPFGLAERGAIFTEPDEVIVYPPIADVREAVTELRADIGEHESRAKGGGSNLYGLREYVPGENTRHVHWRSTAKVQRLVVMDYEKEERKKAILMLSNYVPHDDLGKREVSAEFEKALTFCGSFAKQLIDHGYEVQLVTDSGIVPFGTGPNHFFRIMRALALIQLTDRGKFHRIGADSSAAIYQIQFADHHLENGSGVSVFDIRDWEIRNFTFVPRTPNR